MTPRCLDLSVTDGHLCFLKAPYLRGEAVPTGGVDFSVAEKGNRAEVQHLIDEGGHFNAPMRASWLRIRQSFTQTAP
jgi:hypothetical protein